MADLYNMSLNVSDIYGFANATVSKVCIDPTNPNSCGAWIFGNLFLFFFALFLFAGFRMKTDVRGAFAGSMTITAFISIFIASLKWVDPISVILVFVLLFLSLVGLWTRKLEYITS